jgi:BON domain
MLRAKLLASGLLASGIAIVACLAIGISPAGAQSGGGRGGGGASFGQSGFGSGAGSGLGGGSGFGSGTNGFSGFGGSAFGNSSSFGGSFGNAFGSNGFGSSGSGGFGGAGMGGGQGFGQGGNGGQGGQQFIGRSDTDMQSMMKSLGKSSNQFFQQLNRSLGQGNRGRQISQQKENARLPVRVRLDVAFDAPRPQPSALAAAVHGHIDKLLALRKMPVPGLEVDGDTVVLSGTAESDNQRLVIEKLVSLEPGVSQVLNQMTVAESSPVETMPQPAGN